MQFTSLTVKIAGDIRKKLKQRALDEGTTVWRLVNQALIEYFNK